VADKPGYTVEKGNEVASPLQPEALDSSAKTTALGKKVDTTMPQAFGSGAADLKIVNNDLAIKDATEYAKSLLTKEQLARVEKEADIPFRYIQGAGNHGKIPTVSEYAKSQEPIPMEKQADVKRWIIEAARAEERNQHLTAQSGDSYWKMAHGVVTRREGRTASDGETMAMFKSMAALNGKSEEEAAKLQVGEVVNVPPPKRKNT